MTSTLYGRLVAVTSLAMLLAAVTWPVEGAADRKQCQEITIPMCKGIGYNYTYMPNQVSLTRA